MLLKSLILRSGGSRPNLGGTIYPFTGPAEGPHTCEVFDEDDIATLLDTGAFAYAEANEGDPDAARLDAIAHYRDQVGGQPSPEWTTAEIVTATFDHEALVRAAV